MSTQQLILELKENNQDFEFYPTTDEMLAVVISRMKDDCQYGRVDILDIGCGQCAFKKNIDKYNESLSEDRKRFDNIGYEYYVIEKSEILLNRLPKNVYVLGTDFNSLTLIDKKVDVIFCNPPYSEYENWTTRIIKEGNFQQAYLVIPQRWKENKTIQQYLELTDTEFEVLDTMDFYKAERQARAVVDIVRFSRRKYSTKGKETFDIWFEETFEVSSEKKRIDDWEVEKQKFEETKKELISCNNKIERLVGLYQADFNKLYNTFKQLCSIDENVLGEVGVNYGAVKEALKKKIADIKILYWKLVFEYLDEITDRLTYDSRQDLFNQFERLNQVDFNESNIRSVVIWVIKNASQYYEDQLIDLYKKLSDFQNIKPYKSNEKLFTRDEWRWNKYDSKIKYTLDYRMVCSYLFKTETNWEGKLYHGTECQNRCIVDDFCAIARNLGFEVGLKEVPSYFGQSCSVLLKMSKTPLFEFKIYKNGNTHIKLNKEFAKAMNVEVSRLLGWIRNKQDIAAEFPEEMAKGAEKYFKTNFAISLENPNIKLLTAN